MAKNFAILVIALTLAGCAGELLVPDEGALAVIPRDRVVSGHLVVEVRLNGRGPFRFVLDTGATISAVFEHTRAMAAIVAAPDRTVRVLGMTGLGNYPVVRIATIEVGGETWSNGRLALLPDTTSISTHVDGILGLDFLEQYAIWYSDSDRAIHLYEPGIVTKRAYRGWNSIPLYELRVGDAGATALVFDIYVDAHRIPAVFDLGSTVNLMNRRAARALNVPVKRTADIPDILGVTGTSPVLVELLIKQLQIERMPLRRKTFLVGDFPVFELLDLEDRPVAIAGIGFFRNRDFVIDFAGQRLLVKSGK